MTRPGDGLATVSGRRPAAYGRGWRPRGEANAHGLVAPVSTSAPGAPPARTQDRLCVPLSRSRSQALSGIKESEACRELWSHTWRSPVPWCGQRVHGPSGNARMHGEPPCAPEHTPGPTGTRGSQGAHLRQGPPEPTHPVTLRCRPMYKGCRGVSSHLYSSSPPFGCRRRRGRPPPRVGRAPSSPVCSRLVPGLRRASPAPCAHDSWRQPCG